MNTIQPILLTDSKLAMWRSLIAFAYADHYLSDEERKILHEYIPGRIAAHQRLQLESDIQNGVKIDDVCSQISDIRDRAHLLNIGRVLFHADGDFSAVEQKIYEMIYRNQQSAVDFNKVKEQAQKVIEDYEREEEEKEKKEKEPPLKKALRYLLDNL